MVRGVSLDNELEDKKRAHFQRLLEHKRHLHDTHNYLNLEHPNALLVADRQQRRGKPGAWRPAQQYAPYDLREVLPNEVLFDIGDNTNFPKALTQSHTLWDMLDDLEFNDRFPDHMLQHAQQPNGDYWGALSGGRGLHTHVFLDMPRWNRDRFFKMRRLYASATVNLLRKRLDHEPDVDQNVLHHNEEARIVRAFGARKNDAKTLIARRGERRVAKGTSRDESYAVARTRMPEAITPLASPIAVKHHEVRKAVGRTCPKRTSCFTDAALDGLCTSCPAKTW
jgi:hypothetical protein